MTHIQGITSFPKGAPGPSGTACQNPAPIGLTLDRPILTEESGRSRYLTLPLLAVALLTFSQLFGCGGSGGGGDKSSSRQLFEIVIENVSTPQTLLGPSKQPVPVVLSPVLFVVHSSSHPIFTAGQIAGNGLEVMAEEEIPQN